MSTSLPDATTRRYVRRVTLYVNDHRGARTIRVPADSLVPVYVDGDGRGARVVHRTLADVTSGGAR